jgi:hypothetical protein
VAIFESESRVADSQFGRAAAPQIDAINRNATVQQTVFMIGKDNAQFDLVRILEERKVFQTIIGMPTARKSRKLAHHSNIVPAERIERSILVLRGQKVLLDHDLALLYGVTAKQLNQSVKRNLERFPVDFAFRLTTQEFSILRSQIVTSRSWGGRRYLPYAFTEHGAVMLASVLRSPTAVTVSIQVVRAFVRIRQLIAGNEQFRRQLAQMERKLKDHDQNFSAVFEAINHLIEQDESDKADKSRIGYDTESKPRS